MQQAMSSPSALPVSLFAAAPALAQADRSLQAWVCLDPAPQAAASGPLAGLDFGVKDVLDVAGLPTRCGSPASDATPATADADCVARLRAAGARPLGKTVTAEFAHVWPGPTRNRRTLPGAPPADRRRPWPPAWCLSPWAPRRAAP